MVWICKYCNKKFSDKNVNQYCGHSGNCYKNLKNIERRKQLMEKKRELILLNNVRNLKCHKCNVSYKIFCTDNEFKKNKFRKHCSRSCANGKVQTKESNRKRSEKLKGKIKVKRIEKVCKYCSKHFFVKITVFKFTCGHPKCVGEYNKTILKGKTGGYNPGSVRNYKSGYYKGVWLDSSWEKYFMMRCEMLNIECKKNFTQWFSYYNKQNEKRKYYPDFYLPKYNIYIEIKGYFPDEEKHKLQSVLINNKLSLIVLDKLYSINNFKAQVLINSNIFYY